MNTELRRYTKPEVDAALEQTARGNVNSHNVLVLAGEVVAMRLQYRSVARCAVHNCRMHIPAGVEPVFVCWRCNEGAKLDAKIGELTAALRAATACPSGSVGRDEHGQVRCRYRELKQQQVHALQLECDKLRNELAQLRVEYHFLLEGTNDGT